MNVNILGSHSFKSRLQVQIEFSTHSYEKRKYMLIW